MSLECFHKLVMKWLKECEVHLNDQERHPCKLILGFDKLRTIQNAAELKNYTIVSYHGYGDTYTFKISFRGDLHSYLNSFRLCIECDWTSMQNAATVQYMKQTHSCSIEKIPDNVRELPTNLRGIVNLFIENS
jgi:hypothetical protein